jgi:uncharacterized repeat protein (TIGR03806 family)
VLLCGLIPEMKSLLASTALLLCALQVARAEPAAYGLESRAAAPKPYLLMPHTADGKIPTLLSQTGAFKDTRNLVPSDGLIPYELVLAFWSDGADKLRWISLPKDTRIGFSPTGEWAFPDGTVFIKTFELPVDTAHPEVQRRLETRLLVRDSNGGVYGVLYKWRADNSDADLLSSSLTEDVPIKAADGITHNQTWYYPSRQNCLECHNARAGGVLGLKTRQLNHDFRYPGTGITDNELRTWNHLGLFTPSFQESDLPTFAKLAKPDDTTRTVEDRARSYLDANCSQCHRPGGTVANFDARYDTPPDQQNIVDGRVLIDERIDHSRVIAPNDIWRSIMYMRVNTTGEIRMPPLARETIDEKGVALLRQWIASLPGRPVVDPPRISPAGGTYKTPVKVSLNVAEQGADIRYTLDGSTPTASDPKYDKPLEITSPTVVRARAFKDGYTRSIASQGVFIVGTQ